MPSTHKPDLAHALVSAARQPDPRAHLRALLEHYRPGTVLRALASLQDAQFATAQAQALGLSVKAVARLVATGEAERLRRGVCRFRSAPGEADPAVTAWLACWPDAVISHASAAARHGLIQQPPALPEVTVLRGVAAKPSGVVVHATRVFHPRHRILLGAVPYTVLARTVCDLADPSDVPQTLTHIDNAAAAGADHRWIHHVARSLSSNGRAGVGIVREATAPGARGVFRSWLERAASVVYKASDLPLPHYNVAIRDCDGRRIGVVDALWLPWEVVVETEGLRFHSAPAQRRKDAERFNRILEAGYALRRFTWLDIVNRPEYIAASVGKALRAAGAEVDLARIPTAFRIPGLPFGHRHAF